MPTKVPGICVIVLFSKIAVTSCQSVTTRQHNLFSVYKAYLEIRSVDDDDNHQRNRQEHRLQVEAPPDAHDSL
jgi:hypothetical protein